VGFGTIVLVVADDLMMFLLAMSLSHIRKLAAARKLEHFSQYALHTVLISSRGLSLRKKVCSCYADRNKQMVEKQE